MGINLGVDSSCEETGQSGNIVRQNTISDSQGDRFFPESTGDGILISPFATNTLVAQNTLLRNADDGIDVQNPTTILRRNTANRNGDLGIEALSGAVDGGRNVARGNGNPVQCLGVRCT
jgi:parallel beta-helix repeat protein